MISCTQIRGKSSYLGWDAHCTLHNIAQQPRLQTGETAFKSLQLLNMKQPKCKHKDDPRSQDKIADTNGHIRETRPSKLCEFCIKSCAERRKMTAVN